MNGSLLSYEAEFLCCWQHNDIIFVTKIFLPKDGLVPLHVVLLLPVRDIVGWPVHAHLDPPAGRVKLNNVAPNVNLQETK